MVEQTCIIATIAPEATLKSPPVRKFIEKKLKDNIKLLMKNNSITVETIDNIGARYAIETSNNEKAFELLKKCFGIDSLSFTHKISYKTLEDITAKAPKYFSFEEGSFAVKGKSYSKDFSSKKLEEECGGTIIAARPKITVNLSKPENTLHCIATKKYAYFFSEKIPGAKGMPVGTQGAVALICSGKKDEKLAWLLMQNGCSVKPINGKLKSLTEWNSSISIKQITIEEAKSMFLERWIGAFFTSLTDPLEIAKISQKIGTKAFSPLIIDSYKTPFG